MEMRINSPCLCEMFSLVGEVSFTHMKWPEMEHFRIHWNNYIELYKEKEELQQT